MRAVLFILLIFFIPICHAHIQISEIMYNPKNCSYYDCEWIELHNNGNQTVDLSNWTIDDNNFDDVNISPGEYIVVAHELVDCDSDNKSFECGWGNCDGIWNASDGNYTAIDIDDFFRLSNNGDTIILKNASGGVEDNVTYNNSMGANGDGNSLQFINNSWQACIPTPGLANNCSSSNISGCDLSVSINVSDFIFNQGVDINYKIKTTDLNCQNIEHNYSVQYWIIDLFNSYLKEPHTTTAQIKCSDTLSRQKKAPEICGSELYYIEAEIVEHGCNDSNALNDFARQMIVVKGSKPTSCQENQVSEEKSTTAQITKVIVKIIEAPESAAQGEKVQITANITNNLNTEQQVEVYSYIYSGHVLASEGGWSGNSQQLTINPDTTKTVFLTNTIKSDANPGNYTLKVRVKIANEKYDATQNIEILQGKKEQLAEERELEKNLTQNKLTCPQPEPCNETAEIIWTSKKNQSMHFALLTFSIVLIILTLALIASKR